MVQRLPWLTDSCSAGQKVTCPFIQPGDWSLNSKAIQKRTLFLSQLNPVYSHIAYISKTFLSCYSILTYFLPSCFQPKLLMHFISHLILLYLIIKRNLTQSANYEAPHHAVSCRLALINLSSIQVLSFAICFQTLNLQSIQEVTTQLTYSFISSYLHFMDPANVWASSWSAQNLIGHHMLCNFFCDIHHVKEAKVLVMMASCGQTWSHMVFHVLLIVSVWTCLIVQWKQHQWHMSHFWILVDCSTGNLWYSLTKSHIFSVIKELLCMEMASQITAKMVSSLHSSSELCCF